MAWRGPRKISLVTGRINSYCLRRLRAPALPGIVCLLAGLFAGCATPPLGVREANSHLERVNVRTTAYCSQENGSSNRNALGQYLSGRIVRSAASDWSRFPLGTRFRIVDSDEEYLIDDYGTALLGTNTIDLFKATRLEMKQWGVRRVNIDILQWGSLEQSVKVLTPRAKNVCARRMLAAIAKKKKNQPL
jgi:3D (Asp-Asp-Asp) domain-containing protein